MYEDSYFDDPSQKRSLFIEKFEDIGMLDPTIPVAAGGEKAAGGKEGKPGKGGKDKSPKKKEDKKPSMRRIDFVRTIYPECKMESKDKCPTVIFLPTAEIMRKMIKGCIKVDTPAEILDKC